MNRRAAPLLLLLLLLPLLCTTGATRAARDTSVPASTDEVERFAAKLSAAQWRDRRDAVAWLIDAGPRAELPLRRLVDQTRNPEARNRAERVLKRIEQVRRVEPASVTLALDRVDVATAFRRLAEIEGAELPTDPPDLFEHLGGTVTVRFDGQTYWEALLDLCRRAGLAPKFSGGAVALGRAEGSAAPADAVAATGLFLVRARLTRWSHDPGDPGRSVRIELYAEPRAEVLRGGWHVALAQATDEHGQSLKPLAESGINMGGAERLANGFAWSVPLRPAPSADTRLARLRGQVQVVLAEQVVNGQAPDHAGDHTLGGPMPINLPCGAVSASVLRMVKDDPAWSMEMQVDTDPAEADWEAVMESLGTGGLRAFDAEGRELALQNVWRAGAGPSNAVRCKWGGPSNPSHSRVGDPFKLVWRIPGKTVRATVPFDLNDVRLGG